MYAWIKKFSGGHESVEGDHRSVWPTTSLKETNIERVRELLHRDRRLIMRMLSDDLDIRRETVRKIVIQDLRKLKPSCSYMGIESWTIVGVFMGFQRSVIHMMSEVQSVRRGLFWKIVNSFYVGPTQCNTYFIFHANNCSHLALMKFIIYVKWK